MLHGISSSLHVPCSAIGRTEFAVKAKGGYEILACSAWVASHILLMMPRIRTWIRSQQKKTVAVESNRRRSVALASVVTCGTRHDGAGGGNSASVECSPPWPLPICNGQMTDEPRCFETSCRCRFVMGASLSFRCPPLMAPAPSAVPMVSDSPPPKS